MIDKSHCIVICICCGILSIIELYSFSKDDSVELKMQVDNDKSNMH